MAEFVKRPAGKRSRNPMIDDEVIKLLNFRVQQEELSSRLYLAMSLWLNNEGYTGAASLWKKYSDEEMSHADWARNYLLAMGVTPETPVLAAQPKDFDGLPYIIRASYDHEVIVTKQIKELALVSARKGDYMLHELALKYLKEQVEEHDKTQTWIDKLAAFGEDPIALRLLDNEMGG